MWILRSVPASIPLQISGENKERKTKVKERKIGILQMICQICLVKSKRPNQEPKIMCYLALGLKCLKTHSYDEKEVFSE